MRSFGDFGSGRGKSGKSECSRGWTLETIMPVSFSFCSCGSGFFGSSLPSQTSMYLMPSFVRSSRSCSKVSGWVVYWLMPNFSSELMEKIP